MKKAAPVVEEEPAEEAPAEAEEAAEETQEEQEEQDEARGVAEQLCRDIPRDVCVLAYNMTFEKTRIKGLAALYPDLADHLMNIHDHGFDDREKLREVVSVRLKRVGDTALLTVWDEGTAEPSIAVVAGDADTAFEMANRNMAGRGRGRHRRGRLRPGDVRHASRAARPPHGRP